MRQSIEIAAGTRSTMPNSAVSCSRMAPSHNQNRELQPEMMVRMTAPEPRSA